MKRINPLTIFRGVLMTAVRMWSIPWTENQIATAQDTKPAAGGRVILERAGASANKSDTGKPTDASPDTGEQTSSTKKSGKNPSNLPSPQFAVFGGGMLLVHRSGLRARMGRGGRSIRLFGWTTSQSKLRTSIHRSDGACGSLPNPIRPEHCQLRRTPDDLFQSA